MLMLGTQNASSLSYKTKEKLIDLYQSFKPNPKEANAVLKIYKIIIRPHRELYTSLGYSLHETWKLKRIIETGEPTRSDKNKKMNKRLQL